MAVVVEDLNAPRPVYDAFVGRLSHTYAAPRLAVRKVALLGAGQKRVRLVRGVWTRYDVTVRNTGQRPVPMVRVNGNGKGLKVRGGRSALQLRPGQTTTVPVRVRLTGKKKRTRIRLVARAGNGVRAVRALPVRRVKPPKRPVNGRYRNKQGNITFQVRKGRVTNFRIRTRTRCGTYLNPTQTTNNYTFPARKIPKNGILHARQQGKVRGNSKWAADLSFRAVGRKVTRGTFLWNQHIPGSAGSQCQAVEKFTATRVGR